MDQVRWGWTCRYQQAQPGSAELTMSSLTPAGLFLQPLTFKNRVCVQQYCWMTKHTQHMWAISMYLHQLIISHHVRKCAHTAQHLTPTYTQPHLQSA